MPNSLKRSACKTGYTYALKNGRQNHNNSAFMEMNFAI